MNPQSPHQEPHAALYGTSAELFGRLEAGDQDAAEEIFRRYIERLTRLARSRLSPKLAQRTDPEDVVMSAWRSFFLAAGRGRFSLARSGDLWRILVSITLHKLYRQVRRHQAEMRDIGLEISSDNLEAAPWGIGKEPTPEEAVALAEEMETLMASMDEFGRRVLELRLQGETHAEIAADTRRSERSVRRKLAEIRRQLTLRLGADKNG